MNGKKQKKKESQAYHFYKVNTSRRLFHILDVKRSEIISPPLNVKGAKKNIFLFSFLVVKKMEKIV
jgi:hypothetical protein